MKIHKFVFRVVPPAYQDVKYAYYDPTDEEDDNCLMTSATMEVVIQMEVNDRTYGHRQVLQRSDIESHLEHLIRAAYYGFRDTIEKEQT